MPHSHPLPPVNCPGRAPARELPGRAQLRLNTAFLRFGVEPPPPPDLRCLHRASSSHQEQGSQDLSRGPGGEAGEPCSLKAQRGRRVAQQVNGQRQLERLRPLSSTVKASICRRGRPVWPRVPAVRRGTAAHYNGGSLGQNDGGREFVFIPKSASRGQSCVTSEERTWAAASYCGCPGPCHFVMPFKVLVVTHAILVLGFLTGHGASVVTRDW